MEPVGGQKNGKNKSITEPCVVSNSNNNTFNPPSHNAVAPSDDWTPTQWDRVDGAAIKNRNQKLYVTECVCVRVCVQCTLVSVMII